MAEMAVGDSLRFHCDWKQNATQYITEYMLGNYVNFGGTIFYSLEKVANMKRKKL